MRPGVYVEVVQGQIERARVLAHDFDADDDPWFGDPEPWDRREVRPAHADTGARVTLGEAFRPAVIA